jgi:peroxiredoxin
MRTFILLPVLALVVATTPLLAQTASQDPAVAAALHEANDFRHRQQLTSALDSARKALKLSKNNCDECQRLIVDLNLDMERPHDAASAAAAWASHASSPKDKADAELLEARALILEDHEKPNDSLLKRADQVLGQAASDDPSAPSIHLLEGRVLAALKREADAKAQFQACAAASGATPLECRRAAAYAQNIALAKNDEAPAFTITRPDGSPVTLDSLAGKVVLVDFWATWCGPCNRDLSYVQSIADEYTHDNFVLLGISIDESESAWKQHIADNHMVGIQVRDTDHKLADLFHAAAVPTYLILDGNGLIRFRTTGALKDLRSEVRDILKETAQTTSPKQANAAPPAKLETAGN